MNNWIEKARHSPVMDLVRVVLGLFLFFKGVMFLGDIDSLQGVVNSSFRGWSSFALVHYIAFAHLVGGIMIAIGLFTRLSVIVQIPILLGAVFFVNAGQGVYTVYSEFIQSLVVLLLLIVYAVVGSGEHSVDRYFYTHRRYSV